MVFSKRYKNKLSAAFLLLTFLLAVTPKLFVHALFASHVENVVKHHSGIELSKSGYNCLCDDQVAESVFESPAMAVILPPLVAVAAHVDLIVTTANISRPYTHLRGPPAVV